MRREQQWFMMELLNLCACLLILVPLFSTHANSALDKSVAKEITNNTKPGFISIDCGSTIDYLDNDTGIWYQTDKDFVETGTSYTVSSPTDLNYRDFGRQLSTLRCFREGNRNCYTLKPEQGKNHKYLIRAFFSYGNYDANNQPPLFDLYLGVNLWHNVNVSAGGYNVYEIVHTPSTDIIQVCLGKTGQTIPCISLLELRPLNSSIYEIMPNNITTESMLSLEARIDVGSPGLSAPENNWFFKHKDDVYDRIWRCDPLYNSRGWYPFDEQVDIGPGISDDAYKLPAQVWKTAASSRNASYSLNFDFDFVFGSLDKFYEYYVYFHFAEIKKLPPGQKRNISITLNNETLQPLVLEYLKPVTISPQNPTPGSVSFSISAASESDAPPILNAFEVLRLIKQLKPPTDNGDIGAILDIKSGYHISRPNWQGDPCVPMPYAWEGLVCSFYDTNPRITSLNLSSSELTGEIDTSFSYLTELEILDLSYNQLEGPVPEFLAELPKLKFLNLKGNKLSGSIPKALKEKAKSTLKLSVDNNPDLSMSCMSDSCKRKNFVTPLVASISALTVIILIALGFWIFKRRQRVVHSVSEKGASLKSKHRAFSYSEILNITDNFKTIVGEGGFGKVYFGILQDGMEVAVKLLSPSSMQGYKEFRSEAQLLMVVHHRNLVSLIGYCDEGEIKALIYEYMTNGNLQQHLSGNNPNVLKWIERLKIAVDAGQGLDYLHNGCKPSLVHRDLKTSNILLDQNMRGKIADFGLCRAFANDIDSHISTRPAGTLGYVDPEFQKAGNSNKKSDIYSFGIILLELITGQYAVLRAPGKNIHILEWVMPIIERGDIQNIVDPRLQEEFDMNSAWKAVEIALSCILPAADERPDISEILAELKECLSFEMVKRYMESSRTTVVLTSLQIDSETSPLAR